MREYECKDIIRSINGQRIDLRKIVLVRTMSNLGVYIERTPEKQSKEQVKILINELTSSSKHWVENEFLEITYNPKGGSTSSATKPDRKSTILSNPNPEYADDKVIEAAAGPWSGEQKSGPSKPVLALPPHKKVLSKKNREMLNEYIGKTENQILINFHEFVEIVKKFQDNEIATLNILKEPTKKTILNDDKKQREIQNKIDYATSNIKSTTKILSNLTTNLSEDSSASKIITNEIIHLSQQAYTKKIGEKLSYKFEEFRFYSILRRILTKSNEPEVILQELFNNKTKLTNCIKFFDNNASMNNANSILNTILGILIKAE